MKAWIRMCTAVILTTLVMALLGGCVWTDGNGLIGNGQMVTEEREIERALAGIIDRTSFDIVIDSGLEGKAIIEGESNLIKLVELDQDSEGVLTVGVKQGTSIIKHNHMTVRIPAINGGIIRSEGSGDITLSDGTLEGESYDVSINGSGDIRLRLETKNLEVSINGSGDMNIKGSAERLGVSVAGSGNFSGIDFAVGDADVNVSGSGDVSVNVSGRLTGSVGGSGDVIYDGHPESVNVDTNGSGDVYSR